MTHKFLHAVSNKSWNKEKGIKNEETLFLDLSHNEEILHPALEQEDFRELRNNVATR